MAASINANQLNQTSAKIEKIEQKSRRYLSLIECIDSEMRVTIGLASDVAQAHLTVIQGLISQPPEQRNYQGIPAMISLQVDQIREDYHINYHSLLGARDACMIQGQKVLLTPARKVEMKQQFSQQLEQSLHQYQSKVSINPETDLSLLRSQLEESIQMGQEVHGQLLDRKTALTLDQMELFESPAYQSLLREKQEIIANSKIDNIWSAAQVGASDHLEQIFAKLWFWQKKKVVNQRNSEGWTPLLLAVINGHLPSVRVLLDNKAEVSAKDPDGYHPIHWAAKYGHQPIVSELLMRGAQVNGLGACGRTPLHMAVFNSRPETTQCLLQNGADINARTDHNDHWKTPLHDAVIHNDIRLVNTLFVDPKLDVLMADILGKTPLHHAVTDGLVEIITVLTIHKSFVNPEGESNTERLQGLLRLEPKRNQDQIHEILNRLLVATSP